MEAPYGHGLEVPYLHPIDPGASIYSGAFAPDYSRLAGPATHHDGVAFWYNPTNHESLRDRESAAFAAQAPNLLTKTMDSAAVKHRRTRSGCFTCRSRRVKCDESRPVCDRCKKGHRDCEYPQPSSKRAKHADTRHAAAAAATTTKDPAAHVDRPDGRTSTPLGPIPDDSGSDDEKDDAATWRPALDRLRQDCTRSTTTAATGPPSKSASETGAAGLDRSPPSTDMSDPRSRDETPASSLRTDTRSAEVQARQAKIRALPPDLQKYLQFQQEFMTYYHYFYKLDPTDFVHGEFIDLALSYEPLLYAAVGFAAYHYELQQPDAKLSRFLSYHSRSLSMLRRALEKHAKITEATLLTVLQLATFEEYIGDWVNLVGHHRAAFAMIHELYTHDTMMATDLGRRIFSWYARLDVIVGLMAGNETRLDRQWFEANADWYYQQIDPDPDGDVDIENTLAYFVSANRLIGMDMASLFAKFAKRDMPLAQFQRENATIAARLDAMKRQIESYNDAYYRVHHFPVEAVRPLTADDIVNPYAPGGLFKDVLWPLNFMWIDWYGIEQMQRYQTALLLQQPMPRALEQISLEQCRIYEAIDRWPDAPNGAILGAHTGIGLATVFLKKDARHTMWARQKLAAVERIGYIFPPTFRRKMAEMWGLTRELVGDDSVEDWWLPHNEGNTPMLREMRRVVSERHENDSATSAESLANVRDIAAIFAKLDIRTHSTLGCTSPSSDGMAGSGRDSLA